MPIDLQGLCWEMVHAGGVQVWRGSGVRAVPCCSLQRILQAGISCLLQAGISCIIQAGIQGIIQASIQGAQPRPICQVGRNCCRRRCCCPRQDHHQCLEGKEAGEKGRSRKNFGFAPKIAGFVFLQGMFGKADPYVRATLGNQVIRSQTINNNQVV